MKIVPQNPVQPEAWSSGMNRRDALRRITLLMGGAFIGADVLLRGASLAGGKGITGFTEAHRIFLDEIGETILPATDIPGAKAVGIGAFMMMFVTDCYSDAQHRVFLAGLAELDAACRGKYGKSFPACTPAQRTDLANGLEAEQRAHEKAKGKDAASHYFRMLKELTVLGYFSSEIGCTQALRYIEVPGAYRGDVPYVAGEHAWYS